MELDGAGSEGGIQPVVRPEAYSDSTAWMATYMAGVLKVSNMIWRGERERTQPVNTLT